MDLGLKDRVAFLTGATNEIGRAVCLGLLREGAKVAFCDINVEKGEAMATEIAGAGGEGIFFKTDVRVVRRDAANCEDRNTGMFRNDRESIKALRVAVSYFGRRGEDGSKQHEGSAERFSLYGTLQGMYARTYEGFRIKTADCVDRESVLRAVNSICAHGESDVRPVVYEELGSCALRHFPQYAGLFMEHPSG